MNFVIPSSLHSLNKADGRKKIEESDSLYIDQLDSMMSKQAYGSWWGFVNEHLVRLGEIRLAHQMNIPDLADMRNENINESGFVLIPDAEETDFNI